MNKTIIIFIALFNIIITTHSFAEESPIILFRDLKEVHAEDPILLRGFLYKDVNGRWVLLDKPNIRSCCLEKESIQVIIEGEIPEESVGSSVTMVQGNLLRAENSKDNMKTYILKNASIVPPSPAKNTSLAAGAAVVIAVIAGLFSITRGCDLIRRKSL